MTVYLGVMFNNNGRFLKAISKQVSQARRALFSLLSKAVKLRLPVDIVVQLFGVHVLRAGSSENGLVGWLSGGFTPCRHQKWKCL